MKDNRKYTFTCTAAEARLLLLGVAVLHDRQAQRNLARHAAEVDALLSRLIADTKLQQKARP